MDNRPYDPYYNGGNMYPANSSAIPSRNPYLEYMAQQYAQQQMRAQSIPSQQNVQQASQQQSVPSLRGRVVNHPDEIAPGETPMDGIVSLFPTADMSCIYAKKWNARGELVTQRYILDPQIQPQQGQTVPGPWEEIQMRLASIEQAISALSKPAKATKSTRTTSNTIEEAGE